MEIVVLLGVPYAQKLLSIIDVRQLFNLNCFKIFH